MAKKEKTKNEQVVFKGEVRWATIPPRNPRGPSKDYKTDLNKDDLVYSIEVECSEKKFKALKKAGIPKLTELREDEETGKTFIRVKATKVKTNPKGDNYVFKDIISLDADGSPLEQSVANGSEGIVVAELIEGKKGKNLRLKGVKITNLIPYEDEDDSSVYEALGVEKKEEEDLPWKDADEEDDDEDEDIY